MAYLLLLYAIISFLCCWSGLLFYEILGWLSGQPDHYGQRPLFGYFLSGLMLITALGQWLVLFLPLDLLSTLITLFFLITFSFPFRKKILTAARNIIAGIKIRNSFFFLTLSVFLVMILILNAGPTIMDDTESYHIQMIKWAQEYGTVPGIANLHLRFGFNSSWFISIGLLSPKLEGINHYLALNGLLSFWFCYYLLDKIFAVFLKNRPTNSTNAAFAALFILIIGLALWPMIRGNATTANYDFITTCCILVLTIECAVSEKTSFRYEWICWPFFLCTVRMINVPLLVLSLISVITAYRSQTRQNKLMSLLIFMGAGAFLLIPFLIRNTVLSGYPLFPVYQLDPFSFDWKVSRPLVVEISEYIKYYNRSNGFMQLVSQSPFPAWLSIWHKYLAPYDKIITDLSFVCWIGLLASWKKWTKTRHGAYAPFLLTMLLQLVFWLSTAPDPRFAYGPLVAGVFALILLFLIPLFTNMRGLTRIPGRPAAIALSLLATCVLLYSIRKTVINPEYRNWVIPRTLPVPASQIIVVDGIRLQIPEKVLNNWNPRCYDLTLPCLYKLNPLLRARGKNIRDGFRLDKKEYPGKVSGEYKFE